MSKTILSGIFVIVSLHQLATSFAYELPMCTLDGSMSMDCYGAVFVQTDGYRHQCSAHEDCYDWREPVAWCYSLTTKWT
ncbi:hypothetical protein AB6A40_011139 [Gnathostoma spinigerum]|uniref:Uncharacterized protein n=1 Tax=Gnathostoma spinigerum TaxID=75299 RepID=A0ABD6EYA4_9BILA